MDFCSTQKISQLSLQSPSTQVYTMSGYEAIKFAEDSPELNLEVFPDGDDGSGYHIQNDPSNPFQRQALVQRRNRLDVRCDHKGIVHGCHSDECEEWYSLIIVEFKFHRNHVASRIKAAYATIRFAGWEEDDPDPEVVDMWPNGQLAVEPTQREVQTVRDHGLNGGAGIAMGVQLEVGGEFHTEKTIKGVMTDHTTVRGSMDVTRSFGPSDTVSWTFLENETEKTGIVTSMRGAILLKRHDNKPFKAIIRMKVTADTLTGLTLLFKKDKKDADVLYDPSREAPEDLQMHATNLGNVELKQFCDVTFMTVKKHANKEI